MERTALWSLMLLSFSGASAKTNLLGKVFVFPKTSADSYVLLKPTLAEPLPEFTLCLRYFTDLIRSHSIFSASSRQHDNEIVLIKHPAEYHACVGGQCQAFVRKENPSTSDGWTSVCLTWTSATGITQLWLDGRPLPRKGAAKGHRIPAELVVMLGQEQDSFGGSLDAQQSFVGEITDVFLWEVVLPPEHLRSRDTAVTPLISWATLDFETKGYVVIEPALETDLLGKVFVFPKTSADSYILLKPTLAEPLPEFTLCLRYFTDLIRSHSIFSASSRQHDNEIVLIKHPAEYHACVGGQCQAFVRKENPSTSDGWTSVCLTWTSATGITQLWLDGRPLPRKGAAKGHRIPTELVVMLGQEQDSFGGSLDAQQSFVGEITDVFLWDVVLPPEQLRSRDTTVTPLISWATLDFETKGYVVIEPTVR